MVELMVSKRPSDLAEPLVNGLAAAENAMIDLPFGFVIGYNNVIIFHRLSFLEHTH